MPLTQEQKIQIKQIISNELKRKIQEFSEAEDMNKPFYFELFSKKLVLTHALLQSVFTWFGKKWEDFAEIIAKDNFEIVKREEKIRGNLENTARTLRELLSLMARLEQEILALQQYLSGGEE